MNRLFNSIPFWIGLFLFSVYLLSFSGKFHVMDELAVFTAGNNLAQHGRADINQLVWTNHWTPNPPGIWGQDGHLYTKKAPGISFLTAPLIWLGHTIPDLNAVHVGLLTNALVTALTASLMFIWLLDVGFSRTTATLTTLGYGLCTIAWIYARMFWESSMLALAFLAAVWAVYRSTRLAYARQRLFWVFLGGLAIALGLTLRFETLPAIIFIALYLTWESMAWPFSQWLYTRHSMAANKTTYQASSNLLHILLTAIPWGRLVIYFSPSLLIGLGLLYFNLVRYGSLTETGYTREFLFEAPWIGGFGLLFSPGRGLFIYAPLTLLLFFGLRPAWRRLSRPYFWLIAILCLFYWLFYGSWFAWGGTWGWGPRFLLPILPLLMLFVAEPIEWAKQQRHKEAKAAIRHTQYPIRNTSYLSRITHHASRITYYVSHITHHLSPATLAWLGIGLLALFSLVINLLGILVDFNEHFLRLNRNDNFVFNWATFPPIAHWHILQEGLIDIIWLRPSPNGVYIEWSVLIPALLLFLLTASGLVITLQQSKLAIKNLRHNYANHNFSKSQIRGVSHPQIPNGAASENAGFSIRDLLNLSFQGKPSRIAPYVSLFLLLPLMLVYETMLGTARIALEDDQAQADTPLVHTLSQTIRPGDALLMPMPPFGDVQEVSTRLIAYLDRPVPITAWIESQPRAIQADERENLWHTTLAEAERVWLFERWLTHGSPTTPTAAYLNQAAFPVETIWFEQSGKLTLYAVAHPYSATPVSLNVPFQGGITLRDFTLFTPTITPDNRLVKLRLTWQATEIDRLVATTVTTDNLIVSVQVLHPDGDRNVAQNDRLLVDLRNVEQSPLLPGETVSQGYGLRLPENLPPGSYPLIVNLYRATDGQRLSRIDDSPDDFLYLTDVTVE